METITKDIAYGWVIVYSDSYHLFENHSFEYAITDKNNQILIHFYIYEDCVEIKSSTIGFTISHEDKMMFATEEEVLAKEEKKERFSDENEVFQQIDAIQIEVGTSLLPILEEKPIGLPFSSYIESMDFFFKQRYKTQIPQIEIIENKALENNAYAVIIENIEVLHSSIQNNHLLLIQEQVLEKELRSNVSKYTSFYHIPGIWISENQKSIMHTSGYKYYHPLFIISFVVTKAIEKYISIHKKEMLI